jgi:hypothetical protein
MHFIVGTLPTALRNLNRLQYLNISYTNLEGSIPDSVEFTRMKVFALSNNLLTRGLPTILGPHEVLQYMSVGNNYLTGPVADEIVNARAMQFLDLGNNYFYGPAPLIVGLSSNLTYLVLSYNMFTGQLPKNWSSFRSLQYLFVNHNELSGPIPAVFVNSTDIFLLNSTDRETAASLSLVEFYVSYNRLVGSIPDSLWTHTDLTALSLNNNYLYGTLSPKVCGLAKLTSLDVSTNSLNGNLNEAFIEPLYNLVFANLANNSFSSSLPSKLFASSVLEVATLNTNCFSGTLPTDLCSAASLTSLILDSLSSGSSCAVNLNRLFVNLVQGIFPVKKVEGSLLACLFALPNLTTLQVSGNGFAGSIPSSISAPLVNLQASFNALTGVIPESLQRRGNFSTFNFQDNKLTGALVSDFAVGGANLSASDVTIHLDVNRLSGNIPNSMLNVGTVSIVNGNLFDCIDIRSLPANDPSRETYVCGSQQLNTALYVWFAVVGSLAGIVVVGLVFVRYGRSSPRTTDMMRVTAGAFRPTLADKIRSTTPFDTTGQSLGSASDDTVRESANERSRASNRWHRSVQFFINVIEKTWHNSSQWLSFNYSSRRDVLANTAQYLYVLSTVSQFIAVLVGFYLLCMVVYIILKSGSYASNYSTITRQEGWITTAAYLHGYLPTILLLVIIVATIFTVIISLKVELLFSSANKKSVQREEWKVTHHVSTWSNVCLAYFCDLICLPGLVQTINAVVCLAANATYVSVLMTVTPSQVFFVQCAMSLFKILWVNGYVPYAMSKMSYLPATSQFRHLVSMLLINYIIGPGIASAGANSNCFYHAIKGSPSISSSFSELSTILSCITGFEFVYLPQQGVDLSLSSVFCRISTSTTAVESSTVAPFIYSYQCGASFLIDYIPVLLYSYLFSSLQLPLCRFLVLHTDQSSLQSWLGERIYRLVIQGSIVDCDAFAPQRPISSELNSMDHRTYSIENPMVRSPSSVVGAAAMSTDSLSATSSVISSARSGSLETGTGGQLDASEKPLFDGSLVIAKRILDFAVLVTFGLACPLLAVTIAISVYVNSLSWKLLIGKFLSRVSDNNLLAFSRLERSTEGMLRGALGGMWIAVCAISMFWSVLFFDMIADDYGDATGTTFALVTLFGVPVGLYVTFRARTAMIAKYRRKNRRNTPNTVLPGDLDVWNANRRNTPRQPPAELHSEF